MPVPNDLIGAGYYVQSFRFAQPSVIASQAAVALKTTATDAASGTLNISDYVMPFAASIISVTGRIAAIPTAGTLTLTPTINGTAVVPAAASLSLTTPSFVTNKFTPQVDSRTSGLRLNAGGLLGCTVTTSAGYLPVTSDMEVVIYVLFEVIP